MNKRIIAAIAGMALSMSPLSAVAEPTPPNAQEQPADTPTDPLHDLVCKALQQLAAGGVDVGDLLAELKCDDQAGDDEGGNAPTQP